MRERTRWVICPTCGSRVAWVAESAWKPFCSERCKLIDLGEWASERYRVPAADDTSTAGSDDYRPERS
jgi:endogenous inhibitor of DNA gyrase (YacG/DUF329 family)